MEERWATCRKMNGTNRKTQWPCPICNYKPSRSSTSSLLWHNSAVELILVWAWQKSVTRAHSGLKVGTFLRPKMTNGTPYGLVDLTWTSSGFCKSANGCVIWYRANMAAVGTEVQGALVRCLSSDLLCFKTRVANSVPVSHSPAEFCFNHYQMHLVQQNKSFWQGWNSTLKACDPPGDEFSASALKGLWVF